MIERTTITSRLRWHVFAAAMLIWIGLSVVIVGAALADIYHIPWSLLAVIGLACIIGAVLYLWRAKNLGWWVEMETKKEVEDG